MEKVYNMNKDTMLIKMLAELFDDHAYIQRVVFDRNSKYNTICYITFQCSHARVMYNKKYYWCDIKTPEFKSKEELDIIPNKFNKTTFTKKSYMKIFDDNNKLYKIYNFDEISEEARERIFNKIKYLIRNHNITNKKDFVVWK